MTDWESLSEQLKALGVKLGKRGIVDKPQVRKYPIDAVIEGRFWDEIYGLVLCHEEIY